MVCITSIILSIIISIDLFINSFIFLFFTYLSLYLLFFAFDAFHFDVFRLNCTVSHSPYSGFHVIGLAATIIIRIVMVMTRTVMVMITVSMVMMIMIIIAIIIIMIDAISMESIMRILNNISATNIALKQQQRMLFFNFNFHYKQSYR